MSGTTIEEATQFLLEVCLPKMNAKVSRQAASAEDAHVPLLGKNRADILCVEYERVARRNSQFKAKLFKLSANCTD